MKNIIKKLTITAFIFSLFFSFGLSFAQEATSTPIERFYAWESVPFSNKTWKSLTSNNDGSKVAIIESLLTSGTGVKTGGYIYVSNDGGYSWNLRSSSLGQKSWRAVKYSGDGKTLVAAAAGYYDYIYTSTDDGQTWSTSTAAGKRQWLNLDISLDGKTIVAGDYGQYLYISSDSGVTWNTIETLGTKAWENITLAQNGSKIIVTISNDYLYISSDSGATWATSTELGVKNWESLSSSEDGSKIAITESAGNVFISHDSGQSWATSSPVIGQNYWRDITFSQDGSKIIVANDYNYIYTSSDSGLTWIEQSAVGSRDWDSVTISKDGNKMFAAAWKGNIYVYGPIPLRVSNTKAVVSKNSQISFLGTANYAYNVRGVDYCVREALNTPCAYTEQFLENGSYPVGGFSMIVDNLSPGAYYQYRIFIEDAEGRVYSQDDVIHLDYTAWTSLTQIADKTWIYKYLSADGNNMKLVSNEGEIYTSSDSGNTWDISLDSSLKKFASIASSLDGNKVVAIDREGVDGNGGYIYTSLDSGTTWATSTEAGLRRWKSVSSSFDGSKLLASDYSGNLYVSNNFGESWSIKNLSTKIGDIGLSGVSAYLSASGTKMIVESGVWSNKPLSGFIWISSDDGETWAKSTASLGQKNWGNVSISADGNKIFASIVNYDYIYTSSDGGQTWSTVTALGQDWWVKVSVSADGNIIYATPSGGRKIHTYKSIDGGTTWTEELEMGRGEGNSIQISYDGRKILGFGKYVYVYMTPKAPIIFENGVPTSPDRYSLNLPVYINTLSTAYGIEYCNSGTSAEECFEKVVNIQSGSNYLGEYYVNLNNITPGYYHYRFFAENNEGRTYSSQYMKLVQQNDWYPIPGTEDMNWEQIVVSDDGKYLLIAETYGDVLRSSDYGETWIKTSLPREWHGSVAGSSDGKYLAVLGDYLYLSSDYGQSWTTSNLEIAWGDNNINMSSDGKNLILSVYNDYVQTSSDYGASWTKIESLGKKRWYQSAITDTKDGLIMIALDGWSGYMYISRDGGEVWEENISLEELWWWGEPGAISFSNDGQDIFIAPDSGYIYKSSDYGKTWYPLTESGIKTWVAITSSSDGQKVVAIADDDYIYNSIDGGQTWVEQTNVPMVSWQTVASSASGEYIYAAAYDGTPIYKYNNAIPQAKNVSALVAR